MKKKLFFTMIFLIGAMLIMALMSTLALADDTNTQDSIAVNGPNEFVNWEVLATYAGCLTLTMFITQMLKTKWPMALPTQLLSYIVALVILISANWALGTLTLSSAGLSLFNAMIVSLAANGGYNNLNEAKALAIKKQPDEDTEDIG